MFGLKNPTVHYAMDIELCYCDYLMFLYQSNNLKYEPKFQMNLVMQPYSLLLTLGLLPY